MRDRITAFIALVLLFILIGLSYWYSVQAKKELLTHLSDLASPDFIAEDSSIIKYDKDGTAKAKITVSHVEHYSDGHAIARNPRYYSLNTGSPQITARSDRARMESGGEVIHFYDNVVINQAEGDGKPASRLETSQMDAFPDTQEYKSDKPVKLIRGADVSNGVGMDYDNVERTFKLRSRVQTTIQPRSVKQN
jgi:LPS export ABC transporter protein LptC